MCEFVPIFLPQILSSVAFSVLMHEIPTIVHIGTATLTGEKGGNPCKRRRSLASCVYAKEHNRANGRVEAILPELGVFGKRQTGSGQYQYSRSQTTSVHVSDVRTDL